MSVNPYEPPSLAAIEETPATIAVEPFDVSSTRFACRSFTPESFQATLQSEIESACRDQGLHIAPSSNAHLRVVGTVVAVDEGSQLLRYLTPFLAGASLVHVVGEIQIPGGASRPIQQIRRSHMGALGGRGETLIRLAITRIALIVASEAAASVRPVGHDVPKAAGRYLRGLVAFALSVSAAVAWLGYEWLSSLPERPRIIKLGEMTFWAAVVGAAMFCFVSLAGIALAPKRVIYSRGLLWLVAISGTRSLAGLRSILLVLDILAGAVLGLCFLAVS